jgi:leader peptidase (prepilin peptidase)/N-methyltransferase
MSWTHHLLALLSLFGAGAAVGSFLNVCIHRLPMGLSLIHPPSSCPSCGRLVRWSENVPIVSWLALRGRCRRCSWPIPRRYVAIELGTGLWFAASYAIVSAASGGDLLEVDPIASLTALAMLQLAGCVAFVLGGLAHAARRRGQA